MIAKHISCLLAASLYLFAGSAQATVFQPLPDDIREPAGIYYPTPPDVLRIDATTVFTNGPCIPGDYTGCTLEDVNKDTDTADDFKPEIVIRFTADDFPDDGKPSNATLRLRGASSRFEGLKSYRIKLDSKDELWRGERRLQLNKHISDLTRVRNKLSFDIMTTIPHLPSLRTQFANLFIDNIDYGFYTHIEYVGKEYLTRRDWDEDSGIYKIEGFDFTMRDELLLDAAGVPLNEAAFESVLEIKRGDDHSALLTMIDAVNNDDNNFNTDVLNKHFNLNNFLTWEAAIILMGNTDVTTSNYYLYNPKDTEKFYFLPWDFDSTWGYDWTPTTIAGGYTPGQAYQGPHNLWANAFGRRFLSQPDGLELLNKAVLEIKENYLTPEKIAAFTASYYNLAFPFISSEPDIGYLATNQPTSETMFAEYNAVYQGMIDTVQMNYDRFLKTQHSPMPFFVEYPYVDGNNLILNWEASVDLQGDSVSYDIEIAESPDFTEESIKFSVKNLTNTTYSTPWMLARGDYYLKITARDSANPMENWQVASNEYYISEPCTTYYGVEDFSINVDGVQIDPDPAPLSISIDGNPSDWNNLPFWADADDITQSGTVDWRRIWFAQNTQNIYLAYLNDDAIRQDKLWVWNAYIDTDSNRNTGYKIGSIGVEFLLEGDYLWQYTGNGQNWSWQFVDIIENAVNGQFAEFTLPKTLLNQSSNYKILFYGANSYLNEFAPVDLMLIEPDNL